MTSQRQFFPQYPPTSKWFCSKYIQREKKKQHHKILAYLEFANDNTLSIANLFSVLDVDGDVFKGPAQTFMVLQSKVLKLEASGARPAFR